jgi:hypothetical protein
VAVVLLVVGYAVAVPLVVRLRDTLRERRGRELVVLEAATALVAAGWALAGAPVGVALNVAFLVAFPVLWHRTKPAAPRSYRPGLASSPSNRPDGRIDR